ncbi:MAG: serine--tRNA ligase [Candidatus Eremiobacteraeota bacterium]|nr:serine--tRNA ligase [Candidatus Eremiobacteraeota bacterium]MBV9646837.1 serine--tRNA ligase [Candidatus Eremiobacteraeota bacterium]
MLDLALVRRDPERVRDSASRRGLDAGFVDRVLELDTRLRALRTNVETLKAEKNALTERIARAPNRAAAAEALRPELKALDERIAAGASEIPALAGEIEQMLGDVPNVLDPRVPVGRSEEDNVVVKQWGTPTSLPFTPKPHWEIGEALGILDFERATALSGSRFTVLRGEGARLSRALINFFLDRAAARSYLEVAPPFLVTRETMWSTGQLSKFSDAMFADASSDLFLIPTAEVPLTALHRGEILSGETLPLRYCAYSPCFRKEAGAAGKDTRGLMRLHQFEKVELVWLTLPERSDEALQKLVADSEAVLAELEIPYRVVDLCSADVGFNAARTFDLETWLPSQGRYREISSCSNCTDFQARRSGIRFRRAPTARPEFVHTLNGSGLPVGRTLTAILENFQEADGSVRVPDALIPYAGFSRIGAPPASPQGNGTT